VLRELYNGATDDKVKELALTPPEFFSIKADGGAGPELHGAVYKPAGEGPFPTLVSVYGGPHAQMVTESWTMTADLRAQRLRSQVAMGGEVISTRFCIFSIENP
jgi:dipeptidyl-peptidase-4